MKLFIKNFAINLSLFGLDPSKIISILYLPKYLKDLSLFKKKGGKISGHILVLNEFNQTAGSASGHYFHQDLLVASMIYKAAPKRHIDIGSRIDGFVAHVASFRKIDLFDVRKLDGISSYQNIQFIQANFMDQNLPYNQITDSLSCLHAIEHFGLGRYGDPIDPEGHIKGFNNLLNLLEDKGTLYISVPIGMKNGVIFNAHRVFHPTDIFTWNRDEYVKISLKRFDYINDEGELICNSNPSELTEVLNYGCGIYTLEITKSKRQ